MYVQKDIGMSKRYTTLACKNKDKSCSQDWSHRYGKKRWSYYFHKHYVQSVYKMLLQLISPGPLWSNSIVTGELVGKKKYIWECSGQLLINKVVQSEVRKQHRNFVVVWLDYKKVFVSIIHSLMLKCIQLRNVPTIVIVAIEKLTKSWTTILTLTPQNRIIVSNSKGITKEIVFQGDNLSVLCTSTLNPFSFLLQKWDGYILGSSTARNINVIHNLFVYNC